MDTVDLDVTATPTDIVALQSLTTGTRYHLQNVDSNSRIMLRVATNQPAVTDRAFVLEPLAYATVRPDAAGGVWLWTDARDTVKAVLSEAA